MCLNGIDAHMTMNDAHAMINGINYTLSSIHVTKHRAHGRVFKDTWASLQRHMGESSKVSIDVDF